MLLPTVHQAIRQLLRRKAATAMSVGLLALGAGLAASFYSLLDHALLSGLPYPDGDRLVAFSTREAPSWPMPLEDYRAIAAAQRSFEWTASLRTFNTMVTRGKTTRGMIGSYVTPELFPALGVTPLLGRAFDARDQQPDHPPVALISHRLWHGSYGADPGILGEEIVINREPTIVVGIMPPGFNFPLRHDVWGIFRDQGREWSSSFVFGFGKLSKLAKGGEIAEAREELARITVRLDETDKLAEPRTASLGSFVEANIGDRARGAMHAMVYAALGLLLLTCANLANLRLSETLRRRAELETRLALGAGRLRILRLLLVENLLIGLVGAALALGLAYLLTRTLGRALLSGGGLERIFWIDVGVDASVARFAIGCAIAAALAGALAPLLFSLRKGATGLSLTPRVASGAAFAGQNPLLSRTLVGVQIGLCFTLLVVAGLFGLRARELLQPSLGFRPDHLSSTLVSTYQAELSDEPQRRDFYQRFLAELRQHPQVAAAALSSSSPWSHGPRREVAVNREPVADLAPKAGLIWVGDGLFETLDLPVIAGREFMDSDFLRAAPGQTETGQAEETVAIVSKSLADRLLQEQPIARTLFIDNLFIAGPTTGSPGLRAQVVGVVADLGVDRTDSPNQNLDLYLPYSSPNVGSYVLVRVGGEAGPARPIVEQALERVDSRVGTLDELSVAQALSSNVWAERRMGQVFSLFSVAALLVTLVGIHAVINLLVRGRERELGIRAALGARPSNLRWLVLSESALQLLLGLGLGLAALWTLQRIVASGSTGALAFDLPSIHVVLFGSAAALVAVSSLTASWAPTERAARIDPSRCLRSE